MFGPIQRVFNWSIKGPNADTAMFQGSRWGADRNCHQARLGCRHHIKERTDGTNRVLQLRRGPLSHHGGCPSHRRLSLRHVPQVVGRNIYYRVTAPGPNQGTYHVGLGTMDDTSGISLTEEIFIDRKPQGYAFAGDTRKMTEAEVMAMFGPD